MVCECGRPGGRVCVCAREVGGKGEKRLCIHSLCTCMQPGCLLHVFPPADSLTLQCESSHCYSYQINHSLTRTLQEIVY